MNIQFDILALGHFTCLVPRSQKVPIDEICIVWFFPSIWFLIGVYNGLPALVLNGNHVWRVHLASGKKCQSWIWHWAKQRRGRSETTLDKLSTIVPPYLQRCYPRPPVDAWNFGQYWTLYVLCFFIHIHAWYSWIYKLDTVRDSQE